MYLLNIFELENGTRSNINRDCRLSAFLYNVEPLGLWTTQPIHGSDQVQHDFH